MESLQEERGCGELCTGWADAEGQGKGSLGELFWSSQGEQLLVLGDLARGQRVNSPSLRGAREGSVLARKGRAGLSEGRQGHTSPSGPCSVSRHCSSQLSSPLCSGATRWHSRAGGSSPSTTS